jgi:hypothetical protein
MLRTGAELREGLRQTTGGQESTLPYKGWVVLSYY